MTRYEMSVIVDNIFTTRMRDRLTADQVNSVHSSRTMKWSMKKTVTAVNAVVTVYEATKLCRSGQDVVP